MVVALLLFIHLPMKNKFLLGAIAGASTLIVAVPFFAQMSSAASTSSTSVATQSAPTVEDNNTGPDKEVPDAQEAAVDPSQAKISADAAAQAAIQVQPGTVHENKLNNEHGNLAYKIEITNTGKEYDVLVDAVTGKVIKNWEDGQGGPHEGNDANEVQGKDDANEVNDQANPNEKEDGNDAATSGAIQTAPATSSAQ